MKRAQFKIQVPKQYYLNLIKIKNKKIDKDIFKRLKLN